MISDVVRERFEVWERDGVSLIRGDCLSVLPMLESGSVDAMISDPPFEEEAHTLQRRINRGTTRGGEGDVVTEEPLDFLPITEEQRTEAARLAVYVVRGWILAFCQAEAVGLWKHSLEAAGAKYKRTCVWIKPDGMPQYSGDRPGMGYESIVAAWSGPGRSEWNGGGRHGVFTFSKYEAIRWGHKTQKPESLMVELAKLFSHEGDLVLDPFMGSGTTGVACIKTGRRFIGIELEKKYFDIAKRRCRQAIRDAKCDLFRKPTPQPKQLTLGGSDQ